MKQCLFLLVAFFSVSQSVLIEWAAEDYPNPSEKPELCGRHPGKPSFVCDPNGIISREAADVLDHILLNLSNDTKCPCSAHFCETNGGSNGYLMAVALVRKLKKANISHVPDTVDGRKGLTRLFAFNLLHKHWSDWDKCEELTIIVYSKEDGILLTLPGRTASRVLTNSVTQTIQRELVRFFQDDGNVGQGLHYLTVNYRRVMDGQFELPVLYSHVLPDNGANIFMVSIITIITSLVTTILMKLCC